jgi:hypothetical protein
MNIHRRILDRFRRPDRDVLRVLRRLTAITVLCYGLFAFLLFVLYFLASMAPHPLSLFLGDLVLLLPLLFRLLTEVFFVLLVVLIIMRTSVFIRLRNAHR